MEENYSNRNFMVFDASELPSIDFNQVLETSIDTVRKSIDASKSFVKWDGAEIPSSVASLATKEGPYSYEEMIALLSSPEWAGEE